MILKTNYISEYCYISIKSVSTGEQYLRADRFKFVIESYFYN